MKNVYRGYLKMHPYKSWYTLKNGILIENVYSDHLYCDYEDSFDKYGNIIGSYQTNNRSVLETKLMQYDNHWPIQIGYKFYLIDISDTGFSTMQDVYDMENALNKSDLGKFDVKVYYYAHWEESYKIQFIPYECCKIGATRELIRKSFKEFIHLDYAEYTDSYNKFAATLNEYQLQVASGIYRTNIKIASYFYNVPEEKIITNDFDRPKMLIERLQKKIAYKSSKQKQKNYH